MSVQLYHRIHNWIRSMSIYVIINCETNSFAIKFFIDCTPKHNHLICQNHWLKHSQLISTILGVHIVLDWRSNEKCYTLNMFLYFWHNQTNHTLHIVLLMMIGFVCQICRSNCICVGSDRPSGGRNIFGDWTWNCKMV